MDAKYREKNIKEKVASFLKPFVTELRTEGLTWSKVAKELKVAKGIIDDVREFHPEVNEVTPIETSTEKRVQTPMGVATVISETDTEVKVVF